MTQRITATYLNRRGLRLLERGWARLEGLVNRVAAAAEPLRLYNPLYHLGPLAVFLLLLLGATGIALLVLYRPGMERAFESVQAISRGWLGSLLRTVHRYASDALILVAFLHALKMLLSDRFWGSRWLAWVSGWLLVALFWLIGTMGYFLVWDTAAQWLTEYAVDVFGGAFALSFFGPQAAGRTYSFFVIILFLHAFLPLILAIGVLIHVLRLHRPRYWAPRWLMVAATAVLIVLSVFWPAQSNLPADLRRLAPAAQIDWWYMGFLPLITRLGNPAFWGLSLAALTLVIALPWLWRGRHHGPSAVDASRCTGCAACARECPYNAIEMIGRDDGALSAQLAQVKGHLCTGCGICVAACPEDAIDLTQLELGGLHEQVRAALAQARQAGAAPLLVYACDRHVALGSVPFVNDLASQASLRGAISAPKQSPASDEIASAHTTGLAMTSEWGGSRVRLGVWPGSDRVAVTCALPCMGALHPEAVGAALAAGAGDVLLVACPTHDCGYREGAAWLNDRRQRRPILRQPNVRLVAVAPGSPGKVLVAGSSEVTHPERSGRAVAATQSKEAGRGNTAHPSTASGSFDSATLGSGQRRTPLRMLFTRGRESMARSLVVGAALLAVLFAAAIVANRPAIAVMPQQGQIRIAINHHGQLLARSRDLPPDVLAKLPPGVDPALVLGGERFPVQLQLRVDGELVLERSYRPGGLRREGSIYGLETFWLAPGAHQVEISLMNDGATWRIAYSDIVEIAPGQSVVYVYDATRDAFVQWQ